MIRGIKTSCLFPCCCTIHQKHDANAFLLTQHINFGMCLPPHYKLPETAASQPAQPIGKHSLGTGRLPLRPRFLAKTPKSEYMLIFIQTPAKAWIGLGAEWCGVPWWWWWSPTGASVTLTKTQKSVPRWHIVICTLTEA